MARHKKQRQGKNDANIGKVPQEVAKDKSSLKSVGHEDHQHRWHHSVRNLPPGQIIDIPFLKDLAIRAIVPIAYCTKLLYCLPCRLLVKPLLLKAFSVSFIIYLFTNVTLCA